MAAGSVTGAAAGETGPRVPAGGEGGGSSLLRRFGGYGGAADVTVSGHPVMYGRPRPVWPFGALPAGGGYPLGFVEWAYEALQVADPAGVLHVCSGSMRTGVCVDVRPECRPSVVADGTRLPFRPGAFAVVMCDPPYSELLARRHFGTGYPTPRRLLVEAARVCAPGGRVGVLHYQVPHQVPGLVRVGVHAVYVGPGSRLRAFTIFNRTDDADADGTAGEAAGPGAAAAAAAGDDETGCCCPVCHGPVLRARTGRPPRYCSHACRQAAYRARTAP